MARPRNRSASSWEHSGPSIPREARLRRPLEITISDEAHETLTWLVDHGYGAQPRADGTMATTKSWAVERALSDARERYDECRVIVDHGEDGHPTAQVEGPSPEAVAGRTYAVAAGVARRAADYDHWTMEVDPGGGCVVLRMTTAEPEIVAAAMTALRRASQ